MSVIHSEGSAGGESAGAGADQIIGRFLGGDPIAGAQALHDLLALGDNGEELFFTRRMEFPTAQVRRRVLRYVAWRNRSIAGRLIEHEEPGSYWRCLQPALRWSLSRLRQLVDEPDCRRIIADRENVGLDFDGIAVDILSLRSAVRNGTDAISTDALREATEALEGDFLEGLDLPDCQEFQSWCIGEREDTRRLRRRLLTALVTRLEDVPDEAVRHARA